jgi:hypothetical protein
MHKDV